MYCASKNVDFAKNGDRLINERRDNMMKLKFYLVYLWYKVLLKLELRPMKFIILVEVKRCHHR